MTNKCPNCGFEYKDDDFFCSRCGYKLKNAEHDKLNACISQFNSEKNMQKNKKMSFNKNFINSTLFNVAIVLIAILSAACLILFIILDKHHNQKEILQFKNLIENPAQIPILKESANYKELTKNINNIEDFLLLYLKNSSDNKEKKEQIFSSYLNELEKLPNISTQKIEDIEQCNPNSNKNDCIAIVNNIFKNTGIFAYKNSDFIYLYPDYQFISNKFQNYLSGDYRDFLNLQTKYNLPTSLNLQLLIKPTKLADKTAAFEKLFLKTQNEFIKEKCEEIIYTNTRAFLFTPSIYATTTQEMKPEFKKAYEYFIKKYKYSNLKPLVMSYLDKKRAYDEENFKNDYPYKMFDGVEFKDNIKSSTFEDIFVQLRKNIFANKNTDLKLAYVYDLKNGKWKKYSSSNELSSGEYVLSEPDENNNVSIYNNVFSPMQEMNILKYTKLYLISDNLYIFNRDKLSISKITYNGKTFNTYTLNNTDITSLFPGIEIINIDALQSYNVVIEKENARANYIITSRYSQGWNEYNLESVKGDFNQLTLPNMFSLNSISDVVILFHGEEKKSEEFQENKPSYKFTIRTYGQKEQKEERESFIQYDKKTKDEEENEKNLHTPNIMPKLKSSQETTELEEESFLIVPQQKIEPPREID